MKTDPLLLQKSLAAREMAKREGRTCTYYRYAYPDHRLGPLNASLVQEGEHGRFILSACPKPDELCDHLYHTLLASDCSLWFSLNQIKEEEVCSKFWSNTVLKSATLKDGWKMQQVSEEVAAQDENTTLMKSRLVAENESGKKEITHYHYSGWPDFQAASSDRLLLELGKIACAHMQKTNTPVGINCWAGVGRTGTLSTIITAMQYIQGELTRGKKVEDIAINIPEIHYRLARQRGLWVENKQFVQVYRVLGDYVQELLSGTAQMV